MLSEPLSPKQFPMDRRNTVPTSRRSQPSQDVARNFMQTRPFSYDLSAGRSNSCAGETTARQLNDWRS